MTYKTLCIAAIAASLAPGLSAAIGSASSIRALLSSADSVVVARMEAGEAVAGVVDAIVVVEEAIRGVVKTGDRLPLRWEDPPSARFSRRIEGGRGLFFLKRRGDGGYEILPAVGGFCLFETSYYFLPDTPRPVEFSAAGRSDSDQVFLALAWGASVAPQGHSRRGVAVDLAHQFKGTMRTPTVDSTFQRYSARAATDSSPLAFMAIRATLASGDATAVDSVERNASALSARTGAWPAIVDEVRLHFRNPGAAAVAALKRMAAPGREAGLRLAGAGALANIHTKETLPLLASLLDDPNPEIRALGVGGLAMFANNVPIGSHHPSAGEWKYRTPETMANSVMSAGVIARDPTRYVGFWKTWWLANRAELESR